MLVSLTMNILFMRFFFGEDIICHLFASLFIYCVLYLYSLQCLSHIWFDILFLFLLYMIEFVHTYNTPYSVLLSTKHLESQENFRCSSSMCFLYRGII